MVSKTWTKTAKCPPPVAATPHWEEGDIAFLRPANTFSPEDRRALIARTREFPKGYIPVPATRHPVIVLKRLSRGSTHVLITTVSAYSSGPENDYLAPWKQDRHYGKARADFRSFEGCERSTAQFPPLFLRPGQGMRKPRTSWVHIQSAWVVPTTVLDRFSGVTGASVVGLTRESLDDLRAHMAAKCHAWPACQRRLLAVESTCSPGVSGAAPAGSAVPPAAAPAPAAVVAAVLPAAAPTAAVLAAVAPAAASSSAARASPAAPPSPLPAPAATPPAAPTAVRTWAAIVAGRAKKPAPAAPLSLSSPAPAPKKQGLEMEKGKDKEKDGDRDKGKDKKPWEQNWRR